MYKLLMSSSRVKLIFNNLLNGVYCVDTDRKITYWNKAAEEMSGYRMDEVICKSCRDDILIHAKNYEILCDSHCPLLSTMGDSEPITVSVRLRHRNGYRIPVLVRCLPILDDDDKVAGAIEIFSRVYDEDEIDRRLDELGSLAYLDALTKIPNRRCAEESLADALQAYHTKGRPFAIAMADIDFFKRVNDTYGHDVGDVALKAIADVLRTNVRSMDLVARWGGEEFLILLQNVCAEGLAEKIEFLRKEVESCAIEVGDENIHVTMSFGCALPEAGDTAKTLVERGDVCLYESKQAGRNRVTMPRVMAFSG